MIYTNTSLSFLYTHNKHVETKIKSMIPFTIAPVKMKSLGTLNNVQDLHPAKNKMMMKKIKEDANKWGHSTLVDWKIQYSKDVNSPKNYF